MKFTEEQYHEIIKAWESQSFSLKRMQAVLEIMSINDDMPSNIKEGLALANPASREWAHEQFVEKEKRYVWTSKKVSSDGTRLRLQNTGTNGVVRAYGKYKDRKADWTEHLTESEIKAWGYNPEMFTKEEVE